MRNLFTSQSLAGMTYYVLCMTTKKWREIPTRNLQHRLQTSDNTPVSAEAATVQYLQPGVIHVFDLSFHMSDIKVAGYDRATYKCIVK